eukprot:Sdes_comp19125_c0_seq1m9842
MVVALLSRIKSIKTLMAAIAIGISGSLAMYWCKDATQATSFSHDAVALILGTKFSEEEFFFFSPWVKVVRYLGGYETDLETTRIKARNENRIQRIKDGCPQTRFPPPPRKITQIGAFSINSKIENRKEPKIKHQLKQKKS